MAQLKSKQISDFNTNQDWSLATATEIPNSRDIQNSFTPEAAMTSEKFINQTISSSTSVWTLTTTYDIQSDSVNLAVIYINGMKVDCINSIVANLITFDLIAYNIDVEDELEVHYVKSHLV